VGRAGATSDCIIEKTPAPVARTAKVRRLELLGAGLGAMGIPDVGFPGRGFLVVRREGVRFRFKAVSL
jgi:hypothetical protein